MVVDRSNVDHIMRGLQSTEGVRLHNHRKKLRQRFDIIKKLGQGTYGKVQLGINKETGQEVAIKTIKKCKIETEADLVRIRREIQIMSSVRHPNIIHIYEVFENREKIVLVMEYAAGGELYDYLSQRKVLEETEARRIFRQISTAIYYCHKHKICHRDLKLENILLDEHGSAKIADFGLSNVFDGTRLLSTYCGSPLYASPEIVKGTPYQGPEVDCWSLGVLLYTLVYGAMPFDGSNFKRLVKQISQGDYFEPKKPSTASLLIRNMLTVNSPDRATIEQICSHWWVNQGFNVSCLDIAEDLANQTPVRLDLLLSLAPPPENTEKIVVTDDQKVVPQEAPPRSMSVGSFMELDPNTEERVKSFVAREVPLESANNEKTMKRKLEPVPSKSFSGARKKERTKPDSEEKEAPPSVVETEKSAKKEESNNLIMDIDSDSNKVVEKVKEQNLRAKDDITPVEKASAEKLKETEKTDKIEKPELASPKHSVVEPDKPSSENIAKDKPTRKSVKVVRKKVTEKKDSDKEKKEGFETADNKTQPKKKKTDSPVRENEEESKKAVTLEKEVGKEINRDGITRKSKGVTKATAKDEKGKEKEKTPRPDESPTKPVERRKSKIFETAEKFMTNDQKSPVQEKPKKVYIPGVKVSDFAKAFERRSSVPATIPLKSSPTKKTIIKESSPVDKKQEVKVIQPAQTKLSEKQKEENNSSQIDKAQTEHTEKLNKEGTKSEIALASDEKTEGEHQPTPINDEKLKKLKDSARNIISNALVEEERKKIKKQILKPPVPKTKTENLENRKKSLTLQLGKETATVEVHTPENTRFLFEPENETATAVENKENIEKPKEKKTAKVEITLKSNTLPRRTSKTEVHLSSPQNKKDVGNFRTEVEHRVGDPSHVYSTQRSEVAFPVSAAQKPVRSMSLEPEGRLKQWPKKESTVERIIPIQVEGSVSKDENEARDRIKDLDRPHEGKQKHPYQRTWSLRSNSLSRQSTQDTDAESTISSKGEPIKKSPREFIIPIAVEGGGYVTPRATSLEPSESMSSKRGHRTFSKKFSLWSDNGSEDESPFSTLQRHSSRDLDEPFRLHRLRSSRPTKSSLDKGDSASGSEEEEEDDDGFELLTAENLFSTLLSRVRSLTQRLNVEDGMRPGFPSSRLLSNHFGPSERLFSSFHQPMTRLSERSNFGRSHSRDLENGSNQWSRNDVTNSESNRSVPKGNSKSNKSDSDTESISEYSNSKTSQQQKHIKNSESKNKDEVKKSKKQHYHSRTKSNPLPENDQVTECVPIFDGNRSLYMPSRMWTSKVFEEESAPTNYRSGIPKLQRPLSLMLERRRYSQEREGSFEKEIDFEEKPREKDFYDILAEKYGITNVKRYDLTPEKSSKRDYLLEKRRLSSLEKMEESEKKSEEKINDTRKSDVNEEETLHEKYKGPSEKLAAVLNRLEQRIEKSTKKEGTPVEKKINLGSPAMQELYENTVAEYKKSKKKDEETDENKFSKKVSGRHKSDMSLREFENSIQKEGKHSGKLIKESMATEKSVLSKYLRYSSEDENGKMMQKKYGGNVEIDQHFKKSVSKGEEKNFSPPPKNKFLTSLEKKLEKLKGSHEKKYVDKAIRSLRESSIGPKDVSSENVLIKRAVSVADCPAYKMSQTGNKIHGTVNSVLGMFKKFENESDKNERPESKEKSEKSKIPVIKRGEATASKTEVLDSPSKNFEQLLPSSNRRSLHFTGNGFTFPAPGSPRLDDSPTFLSPDSESFDSGSYCSDLGATEDILSKNYPLPNNLDDLSRESVSDRIRRKSFFSRFNERKKPRRSSLLSKSYDTDADWGEGKGKTSRSFSITASEACSRPSYYRSVSSGDEPIRTCEEARPRPFYKSHISEGSNFRKNSFELPRTHTYKRSESQSPVPYTSLTLPRNFTRESRTSRSKSIYGSRSPEIERPYSPFRPCSPRPLSPSFYSENLNNIE